MTLASMQNNILRFCPGLNPDIVASTVQDSYRKLGMMEWNKLFTTRLISTVGPYSTGTITITAGGTVTGSGTTFTSNMVGRQFRSYYQDSFFEILTVTPPSTLTVRGWPGPSLSTVQLYSIFGLTYSSDVAFKEIVSVAYQTDLEQKSQTFFNRRDPERTTTGTPIWWAYAGWNTLGYPLIEVYPVADQVYPLRLYGKLATTTLVGNAAPYLPEDLIEAHALLDCYRIKDAQDPKMGWATKVEMQVEVYKDILQAARDEDYQLVSHRDKVKDYMNNIEDNPPSDSFWAQHDVE
jgi:hypothetical protein